MKLSDFQKNVLRYIGIRFASIFSDILLKTLRIVIVHGDEVKKLRAENKNFIAAFWHGSMFLGWFLHRNKNAAALVSRSKDGDVLAAVLSRWNYHVVRGSSSTGGHEALDLMVNLLKQNYVLTITPDGPRGPAFKMKAGTVVAAKRAGVSLFLTGIAVKNKIVLKSWDGFILPLPFSRAVVCYSEPIQVNISLNNDEISGIIEECENLLNNLQKKAAELC